MLLLLYWLENQEEVDLIHQTRRRKLKNFLLLKDGLILRKKFSKMTHAETVLLEQALDSLEDIQLDFTCQITLVIFIQAINKNTVLVMPLLYPCVD